MEESTVAPLEGILGRGGLSSPDADVADCHRPTCTAKHRPAGGVIAAKSLREFTSGLSNIVSGNLPD